MPGDRRSPRPPGAARRTVNPMSTADRARRSLADDLRSFDEQALVELLAARPDLTVPLPSDLTSLAARAAGRASLQRCLDGLDTAALQVLEVLALLPEPATVGEVSRLWGAPAGEQLGRLRALALVWGGPRSLHLVRAVRDLLGPHPAGLGPPLREALDRRSPQRLERLLAELDLPPAPDPDTALERLATHLGQPERLSALLDLAPEGAREVLDRLTWGPPVGRVPDADRPLGDRATASPVEWLLASGLLAVADPGHVVLPREVGLALRGGHPHPGPAVQPPALEATPTRPGRCEAVGAGAAAEVVRLVGELGRRLGEHPVAELRAGGIGVRDLRRLAAALEVEEPVAARVLELAFVRGLIASDGQEEPRYAPTPAFDPWRAGTVGHRWVELVQAWRESTRLPGLVGTRDVKDGIRAALGPDLDRTEAPQLRAQVLAALADLPPGRAAAAPAVQQRLAWLAPRRSGPARERITGWVLQEVAWLGLTGAGELTPAARGLLRGDPTAADLLDQALPEPVDHVLLQADLTAVAPGPLVPALADLMDAVAQVESRGGATVYRFSAESVRRALDTGHNADDLLRALAAGSRTPVPQPLAYLVQDTARRHGQVRVGAAGAYLRSDDESALSELLADRRAAALRLRRLAPTVLAAAAGPETVLTVLRQMGLAPAAEAADGALVLRRPDSHRTPPRTPPRPVRTGPTAPRGAALSTLVRALLAAARSHDEPVTSAATPATLNVTDPMSVIGSVRSAVEDRARLWLGLVEADGRRVRMLVEPMSVDEGRITLLDLTTRVVRTVPIHRVTGVGAA